MVCLDDHSDSGVPRRVIYSNDMTLEQVKLLQTTQLYDIERELLLPWATLVKYKHWNRPIKKEYIERIKNYIVTPSQQKLF